MRLLNEGAKTLIIDLIERTLFSWTWKYALICKMFYFSKVSGVACFIGEQFVVNSCGSKINFPNAHFTATPIPFLRRRRFEALNAIELSRPCRTCAGVNFNS